VPFERDFGVGVRAIGGEAAGRIGEPVGELAAGIAPQDVAPAIAVEVATCVVRSDDKLDSAAWSDARDDRPRRQVRECQRSTGEAERVAGEGECEAGERRVGDDNSVADGEIGDRVAVQPGSRVAEVVFALAARESVGARAAEPRARSTG